jgi:hypothetical protein
LSDFVSNSRWDSACFVVAVSDFFVSEKPEKLHSLRMSIEIVVKNPPLEKDW